MKPARIAIIIGTRPEIIKCAPLILELKKHEKLEPYILFTGQHSELAQQTFKTFNLSPDLNLDLMLEDQTPLSFLGRAIQKLEHALSSRNFPLALVQGDTSSALAGALASFHLKIEVAHLEAGLRTFDRYSPFPEEMNRSLVSRLSSIHLCPTKRAADNLAAEGIDQNVFITGNTVVDAALLVKTGIETGKLRTSQSLQQFTNGDSQIVLVTGHRRENFNKPIHNLCQALLKIRNENHRACIIYPVHPNPQIKGPVEKLLANEDRIHLIDPLDYTDLIHILNHAALVITDSGGIQEEAPSFNTPVIVTRESTERPEVLECGIAQLIPLSKVDPLVESALKLLSLDSRTTVENPFGDGNSSKRITEILLSHSARIVEAHASAR